MVELRRALGEGAAQEAPTAPHATPRRDRGPRTGPERFWARWPVRLALAACLVVSSLAHCAVVPFEIPRGFEVKDLEGEADIPVDVLTAAEEPPPPPPPPPPPVETAKADEDRSKEHPAPRPPPRPDAGAPRDAGVADAPADAPPDGPTDAAAFDGASPLADAGPVASGPRDPQAILGNAGSVQADAVLVMVVVNAEVIKQHPVGARMGTLLRGIPQWDEFMSGTEIDPVRDTDWVVISGPSLVNTTRDVVMIHYSAPDAVVDKAVDVVSRKYDHGGPYDAGVPGVRATLAHADRAERVMLRPQPHVLAVVPTSVAGKVARSLAGARVPAHIRPGEAAYIRVVDPHHPMPAIPDSITEMRLRVVPRADQGADVFIDGDTKDADAAAQAADGLRAVLHRYSGGLYSAFTGGLAGELLGHAEVTTEGSGVHVHVQASRDQLERLLALVANYLQVNPGGPAVSPSAAPRSSR